MCSSLSSHILLTCPSLFQHFPSCRSTDVVSWALGAPVCEAIAVIQRLHRRAVEIPSVSSRALISKHRRTAREELALCCCTWPRIPPRRPDPGSAPRVATARLLLSHGTVWGTREFAPSCIIPSCFRSFNQFCSTEVVSEIILRYPCSPEVRMAPWDSGR